MFRWGAAKWVKGQARIYCVNDFDAKAEPTNNQPLLDRDDGIPSFISHADFMAMLEPAWYSKEITEANVMAVLKRTHLFVNTNTSLYVRPASEKQGPVMRISLGDKTDFLHADSRSIYDFHRKGGTDLPQDFDFKVQWEADWVAKAMAGQANLPYRPTIINRGRGLFMDRPAPSSSVNESSAQGLQEHLVRNLRMEPRQLPAEQPSHVKQEPPSPSSNRPAEHHLKREVSASDPATTFAKKAKKAMDELQGETVDLSSPPSTPLRTVKKEPAFFRKLSTVMGSINLSSPSPAKSNDIPPEQTTSQDDLEKDLEQMMHDTEATKDAAEHGSDNHDLEEASEFEHDLTSNAGDEDRMDIEE